MDEKIYALWLSEAVSAGSIFGKHLLDKYGCYEEIYHLSESAYKEAGIRKGSELFTRLCNKNLDLAKKILGFCEHNGFVIIEYTSPAYPERLKAIKNPPPVLYARGRMIDFDDNVCIAVVGTRSYSDEGWNSTYKIASGIAQSGAVVVTGLASGIDTAATRAALDSSGFAVGVLGSGLEKVYPSENRTLFEEMYEKGLVISERAPFTDITGRYFPVRNRIISGLCNAVLVGEGSIGSGALITAAHANEQGRRVFAIPGNIENPESSGVNKLIKDGATPVFDARDIVEGFEYRYPHRIKCTTLASASISVPEKRSEKRARVFRANPAGTTARVTEADTPAEATQRTPRKTAPKKDSPVEFVRVNITDSTAEMTTGTATRSAAQPELGELSEIERKVFGYISESDFRMCDSIFSAIGEGQSEVAAALTVLEIMGYVETQGPKVMKAKKYR
ncbi:MAG: DNA-processing protein DprA [Clostridia bacterium]|nr:DNA-processing protein DprA [Clostridia bacterium]